MVEVGIDNDVIYEWISNYIPHFRTDVITYPTFQSIVSS